MKIENEIERLMKRISLLECQNVRFKNLLDSALEVTKQSVSRTHIQKDETEFLQETIKLIEQEKMQMQEDLNILTSSENEFILFQVKQLQNDNAELKRKIDVLLAQAQKHSNDIDQIRTEHSEIKFLLTQPDSNAQWLKNILQLDHIVTENASLTLMEERHTLQQKIVNLERKKTELLMAIEEMAVPDNKSPKDVYKSDIEKALFQAIDDVAKKEYENMHLKVLELEQERSKLLNELQSVLDSSRKEIAGEYCRLQQKILDIETEKAELKLTLENLGSDPEKIKDLENMIGERKKAAFPAAISEEESVQLEKILNAFTNNKSEINIPEALRRDNQRGRKYLHIGVSSCAIL